MSSYDIKAIIADIGATYTRVAVIKHHSDELFSNVKIYESHRFNAPDEIIKQYCRDQGIQLPTIILLAIAAPTTIDHIKFVNNHWDFTQSSVKKNLLPAHTIFYNDVEMLGFSLPHLPLSSLTQVGTGSIIDKAPKLAVSIGSGVGTSLTVFHHNWLTIPSEGGHANMMINNIFTDEFYYFLQKQNKAEIIIEDFIAGKKGIPQLLNFMSQHIEHELTNLNPNELMQLLNDEKEHSIILVFNHYCAMIGTVIKNYTLITGAKSVYLAGGIIPKFLDFFKQSCFRKYFESSQALEILLKNIPTFVITDPYPALTGLAHKVRDFKEI